ncbi:MAG: hypothetical protein AB1792_01970 [Candidatus Zixiibacteriota bacterium]
MNTQLRATLTAMLLATAPLGAAVAATPAATPTVTRITLQSERVDSLHWEVLVSLDNTQHLAAMTLPFRWGRNSPFGIDSANYYGLRTEYFALKTFYPDSAERNILIGLISDLGSGLPPLEPGSGPIARLFFTSRTPTSRPLVLDTTFIAPHNTLQVVTPDVRAITPQFDPGRRDSSRPSPR